mgnify:CR=1 FL=1
MHGRAGFACLAAFLGERGPDPLAAAQPGDPVLSGAETLVFELVGDKPVPERRIVPVDVHRCVNQVRIGPVTLRDRRGLPCVERLFREPKHPAGHRYGNPVARLGQGPAGTSFWGQLPGEERRCPAQDFVLLLQQPDPLPGIPELRGFLLRHTRTGAVLDVCLLQPVMHGCFGNLEVLAICESGLRASVPRRPRRGGTRRGKA